MPDDAATDVTVGPRDGAADSVNEAGGDATLDGPPSSAESSVVDVVDEVPFPYGCSLNASCCTCTVDGGGTCTCLGGSVFVGCPALINNFDPCSFDGGCMQCSEGASIACACLADAGAEAGFGWFCVGAGYACTGGTN